MSNKLTYRLANSYSNNGYRMAFLAAVLILLGLFIFRVLLIFSFNGEVGGIDNNLVYDVTRNLGGIHPYSDPNNLPYSITLYSPLFYTVCTAIGKLIHINPDEPIQVYRLCRALCLLFDSITCLLLFRVLRKRFAVPRELACLAVACFASIICFLGYTFSRADSFLLAFYAAVIYVLTDRSLNTSKPKIILLALLSVGCVLSKQNGLIAPVLVSGYLLIQRMRKTFGFYILSYIIILAIAGFIYWSIYPFIIANTLTALSNQIDFHWFYTEIFKRGMDSLWILPLLIGLIIALWGWFKPASGEEKAFSFIFLVQVLFSLGTSLKWGSSAGYFNECFFLSFILIARRSSLYTPKLTALFLPLPLLFFLHTIAQGYLFFIQHQSSKRMAYEQQKEVRSYLQPKLEGHYVMNMATPNSDFFKTLFYKEIAMPNMDMLDCCTIPDYTFEYPRLEMDLRRGPIAYIITHEGEMPTHIWDISLDNFHKDTTINGYSIYKADVGTVRIFVSGAQ